MRTLLLFSGIALLCCFSHEGFAQTAATDPVATEMRAKEGQQVAVWTNHVRADKRELFEQFLDLFWKAGDQAIRDGEMSASDREAYQSVRVLYPMAMEQDGTYSYIFLADPFFPPSTDYHILRFLKMSLPEDRAQQIQQMYDDAQARPPSAAYYKQTKY